MFIQCSFAETKEKIQIFSVPVGHVLYNVFSTTDKMSTFFFNGQDELNVVSS